MNGLIRFYCIIAVSLQVFSGVTEPANGKEELVKQIRYHREIYWNEGRREISDREYDKLVAKLRELDPQNSLLKPAVENGGKTVSDKLKHAETMRSLNKCYKKSQLLSWCKKVARSDAELFVIQPKYDGVAVEYNRGRLSTRGDGVWGENITSKKSLINFPAGEPSGRSVGELMISDKEFRRLKKVAPKYVSPRHAVVAMAASNDIGFWQKHKIHFDFVSFTCSEKKMKLSELTMKWDFLEDCMKKVGYLTDGLVVKVADSNYYNELGFTQKFPKGAMAFKWSCERKWTKLRDVSWQLAEKGLVPVGLIEPVELDGLTIRKVSLYNYTYIKKHSLKIGDALEIERVGGTVPVIKSCRNATGGKAISLHGCPECGQNVTVSEQTVKCINAECPGKITLQIYKEIKRRKVKGIGTKTIRKLVDSLNLKNWQDFLRQTVRDLSSVNGISQQKAEKLKAALGEP